MLSSRRKSCIACVKAKKRCDLGLPICRRCATRPSKCTYPWAQASDLGSSSLGSIALEFELWDQELLDQELRSLQAQQLILPETAQLSRDNAIVATTSPLNLQLLSPIMSGLTDGVMSYDQILFDSYQQVSESPNSTIDQQLMPLVTGNPERSSGSTTGSIFQARTEYAARRLSLQPHTLIDTGQTAFIHVTHVAESTYLQEAFAASALFAMQNATNAQLVASEVNRRATLLISTVSEELYSNPLSSLSLLAPAQALLIYQCIRLFSSNIRQRSRAESEESILLSWVAQLRTQIRPFSDKDDWDGWVREESIRRTVLSAEILCGTYAFLKQGWDQSEARVMSLSFTAQSALWEARSKAEWEATWIRGPKLEVKMRHWNRDMGLASPENAEELGVIIRATYLGLDALEEWMGGQQERLIKWGLRP
ncbi:transcription factor cys6 protein [Colletotrichum tofieldiae]|uniref:Transcription factor cys6 protein n=1 Tax=Colletotrichum tofieldiae TaxID=708197 RepID=A0A166PI72_9PEZI|nr:transcription factor cys6 protein [Colletotrichum tofieldiae]